MTLAAILLLAAFPGAAQGGADPAYAEADPSFKEAEGAIGEFEGCVKKRWSLAQEMGKEKGRWTLVPKTDIRQDAALTPSASTQTPREPPLNPDADRARRWGEVCGAEFPADAIIQEGLLTRLDPDNGVPPAANAYILCKAVAAEDETVCDSLGGIPAFGGEHPFPTSPRLCRTFFHHLSFSKALISHDPSARQQCLRWGPGAEQRMLPARLNEAQCDLLIAGEADLPGLCDQAVRQGLELAADRESCEWTAGAHWGLAPRCDPASPPITAANKRKLRLPPAGKGAAPHLRELCLVSNAEAAFRKARAAGDPGLCAGDGLCLAMLGRGAEACQPYALEIQAAKRDFCRDAASRPWTLPELPRVDQERAAWARETQLMGEETKLRADRAKRVMDAQTAQTDREQAKAAQLRARLERLDASCLGAETSGRAALDRLLAAILAIEPRSEPGIAARKQRYAALKERWEGLGRRLRAAGPPSRR